MSQSQYFKISFEFKVKANKKFEDSPFDTSSSLTDDDFVTA